MLIIQVWINDMLLIRETALRIKGDEQPDTINIYKLTDGSKIKHRYGDGAAKLTEKIMRRLHKTVKS